MRTIFKYDLGGGMVPYEVEVRAPIGARPVFVSTQDDKLRVWMLVNTSSPCVRHSFLIRGTGHECSQGEYVGTTFDRREYVWHVFYTGEIFTPEEESKSA